RLDLRGSAPELLESAFRTLPRPRSSGPRAGRGGRREVVPGVRTPRTRSAERAPSGCLAVAPSERSEGRAPAPTATGWKRPGEPEAGDGRAKSSAVGAVVEHDGRSGQPARTAPEQVCATCRGGHIPCAD